MDISLFIANLSRDGFKFEVIENRLSVSSPKEMSLTDEQKKFIKANKQYIVKHLNSNQAIISKINKIENNNFLPLSFAQQRLWFIDKLYNSYAYNMPVAFRIKGELQGELLEQAFNEVVKRHAILRTVFKLNTDGQVYQEVLSFDAKTKIKIIVKQIEAGESDKYLLAESWHKFDLSSGPLVRIHLFNLKNESYTILLINQHHIICDAWSLNLLFKEVSHIYSNLKLNKKVELLPLDIQYADYVIWERNHLQRKNLTKQLEYWNKNLKGYSDLNLVSRENRYQSPTNAGSNLIFHVEEGTVKKLLNLAKKFNATVHMVLLSAFYILLYRYSRQDDIVIGTPYVNRDNSQTENILGFFVNMLPIRININNPTVEELLYHVREKSIDSYQNQNIPFEYIVDQLKIKRDNNKAPIFQVAFAHYNATEDFYLDGAIVERISFDRGTAKYDLNLTFEMDNSRLKGELEFDISLFNAGTAGNLVRIYKTILQEIIQNHRSKISALKLFSQSLDDEMIYKRNLSINLHPQNKTMHQLFEEQAEKTPDNIAVVFGKNQLTYRELNERSNQLANLIRFKYKERHNKDINKNIFIGLYMDRSLEMIISILGVLKSGCAYVPFDIDAPQVRLKFQILDSSCSLILTQTNKGNNLLCTDKEKILLINLDEVQGELPRYSAKNLKWSNDAADPVYIIYTSGSTGKPKGVVQLHHNVRRLFLACEEHFHFTDKDVWTLFHSYSFDFSVWEMWGAFLYGGKLIIPTFLETRDLNLFHKLLAFHKVTILNQTPTAFYELAKIDIYNNVKLDSLRYIIFGGELLKIPLLKDWVAKYGVDKPQLINMYGITEITVHASYKRIFKEDLNKHISNIGGLLGDLTAYVLDEALNLLPIGIPGELYIGGSGLAKCYLNLPELTAQRFISNPFVSGEDKKNNVNLRLYKTGDVVRWLENGDLEYLGRNDNQVQLRGFRIELEEIENKLSLHKNITNAVVLYKERVMPITQDTGVTDNTLKYLVAYYTVNKKSHSGQKITNPILRGYLKQLLPEYMIPSYFVQLDVFPLTTNGKLDKNALPDPDFSEIDNVNSYMPPRNELEQMLCSIWQDILGIKKVSINNNFFEIGGNSILLIQLAARIKKDINLDLSLIDLFTYPNIQSLVDHLVDAKDKSSHAKSQKLVNKDDVAIIGYSGAFSGCDSIDELWDKLCNGIDCIARYSVDDAIKIGVREDVLKQKGYIRATGLVADIDKFDANFFGISPREARFMDPQTRLFMEHSWRALEIAGYIGKRKNISIGVFAGAGKPTYLYDNLKKSSEINEEGCDWEMDTLADPRRISTLTSFYLNLSGPSMLVDTACSTSMAAIVEAAMHLQAGLCEMALAGASTLYFPENHGYVYKDSMVGSSDGICAPFSQSASGIVPGSGVGVVVLKRLEDAIKDKDVIYAVIKGYGINNDGNRKVGYVAPSVQGQRDCILSALNAANVPANTISYIECHGTGTKLGDTIEVSALKEIFTVSNLNTQKQFLGSIKANIGHTDTAAGIASFIKVCKMLESKRIPPQINCEIVNEQINDAKNIFKIARETQEWKTVYPRRAGVTSLGIGGTNVHIILEEANRNIRESNSDIYPSHFLFSISAKSSYSLNQAKKKLLDYLKKSNSVNVQNIAYTLHTAREAFSNRYTFVAKDYDSIIKALGAASDLYENNIVDVAKNPTIVFLCSMLGRQNFDLTNELYQNFTCYRQEMDKCKNILQTYWDKDFNSIINQADYAELVAFVTGYSLSQFFLSLDIKPKYIIGIGIEEYLAACISGVISLEDTLYIIIKRCEIIRKFKTQKHTDLLLETEVAEQLRDVFSKLKLQPAKICFFSNLTNEMVTENELIDSDYWYRQALIPVNVKQNTQQRMLINDAVFVDMGLENDYEHFIDSIGKIWLQGVKINWNKFYEGHECYRVELPAYSFEKERFWVNSDVVASDAKNIEIVQQNNISINIKESLRIDGLKKELVSLWERVLEIKDINIDANFFDLGGNSVIAIRLMQLISDHFNTDMSINTLFENPTISSFSQTLLNCLFPVNVSDTSKDIKDRNLEQNPIEIEKNTISSHTLLNKLKYYWSEVLMVKNIDINANFFDLGGNSVIAIRLIQLISDHFKAEISINTLFENPTIASLNAALSKNFIEADSVFKQIVPDIQNIHKSFPLTDIQRAYVLGRQNLYDLGNVATHAYIERDYYDLDINKVESTFNQLIIRHPMLRVIFDINAVTQRILADVPYYKMQVQHIETPEKDIQEKMLDNWRMEMSHQVLDITTWPIFDIRCSVLPDKIKLHLSFDVLVLDGQSLNILMAEWTKYYNDPAIKLPSIDCSFRDCVINYQNLRQTNRYIRDEQYWLQRIKNFPPRPNLPLRLQPEQIKSPTFKRCAKYIDMEIWNKFKNKCNSSNPRITETAALGLIYGIVLARWSKNDHFAMNLTFFNRLPLHNKMDNIVGDFTSLELLEFNLQELWPLSFIQMAAKLQSRLYTDLDHILFSGVEVQREINRLSGNYKGVSYPIVFTSLLSLNMQGGAFLSDSLIDDTSNDITQTSQVWLDNKAYVLKQGFVAEWDYVEELFPEGVIESMHECYCRLIEYFSRADWNKILLPEMLDNNTIALINSVNAATMKFPENLLHESFFINARTMPDKMAVISSSGNLTYGALAAKANQVANCLKEHGCGSNMLVAVIIKKGWEQLVACYGILQAGSAYLPIDPDWPPARISEVLTQGQVKIILTQNELLGNLQDSNHNQNYTYFCVDNESTWNHYSLEQLPRQQTLDDIAYVLFTSGSTGTPKGAAITHRNVTNTLFDINHRFKVNSADVVIALSNLTFDLSVYDTFGVLSSGGTIVMPAADKTKDPGSWVPLIINNKVTIWNTVPMFMRMLIEYSKTLTTDYLAKLGNSLRIVMMSGDWIPLELPDEIKSLFKNVDVNSVGGPTECSIWSITYNIKNIDPQWTSIPYGKALANQKIYILNDNLEYCPVDVVGNIYIGGVGVGKCYWNDEKLTSEKFIMHRELGDRIFKSGDLGKLRKDGNIEILGREDHQVKISGYRVETGEIKKAIKDIEGVDDVIITAIGERLNDKKLIAYVVWKKKKAEISDVEMLKFKQSHFNLRKIDFLSEKITLHVPETNQDFINRYFKRKSYRQFSENIINGTIINEIFKLQHTNTLENHKYQFNTLSCIDKLNLILQELYAYQDGKLVLPKYRYPSAGSLYPVQIYITISLQADKKNNGSYYYNPHEHTLYKVSECCDFSDDDITINLISNLNAIRPLYGEWSEPFCELECGYISEIFEAICNKLKIKVKQIETKTDLIFQLKCPEGSRYHYSFGINFSECGEQNANKDLPNGFNIYVYVKPDRITDFEEGLYRLENRELKYFTAWQPNDEYLNQIGMLGSTMRAAAFVIFFVGKKQAENNYLIGQISQYLINEALNHNIGSCPLGYFGTNLGGIFNQLEGDILHTIVMGGVSKEQMQSHEYSEPDMRLWDVRNYINNKIKNILPKYMLPESYLEIDKIPLSLNGKVDIKALPRHDINYENKQHISPKNEIEKKISALWCEVLNLKEVSINDNFFEIGGNSIKIITLRNKINENLGIDIDIVDLFNNATIKLLAEKLVPTADTNTEMDNVKDSAERMQKRKKMINRFREEHEEV